MYLFSTAVNFRNRKLPVRSKAATRFFSKVKKKVSTHSSNKISPARSLDNSDNRKLFCLSDLQKWEAELVKDIRPAF